MLMRVDNVDERKFYEIEATENNWSLRELRRQFDSALYERLALSRNKAEIRKLSEKGQIIETDQDSLKEPYVLKFLGLEHFLLELGKGYTFVGRQVRFTFDDKHFRVDLVFYNLLCFST